MPAHAAGPNLRTPAEVTQVARGVSKIADVLRHHPGSTSRAFIKDPGRWQVSFSDPRGKEIAQVYVSDATGEVLEAWTGFQVAWTMARGYDGAFGHKVTSLWVWLPLCLLFLAPFVTPRRPWRLLHLDLLVLLAFSVSLAFFSSGTIGLSVPLAYPVLLYVLGRMLWIGSGRGRGGRDDVLRLNVRASWLAVGVLFLVGFRVGLNVVNSNVIDVGYSGVIGAQKILHGEDLYGGWPREDEHGDTYGPANSLAYVPAVAALGWSGRWDDLPAAHAAAILFDLLTLGGLFLLGRRVRGPTLGVALAWAWVAYPFTLFASSTNANDSLVSLLVVGALLGAGSAPARGLAIGLAGMAKLAPLGLAPLFFRVTRRGRFFSRETLTYCVVFLLTCAAMLGLAALLGSGPGEIWQRTVGFQAARGSPFSVWGLWGWPGPQKVVQGAAVLFCLSLALVPRGARTTPRLAALAAAALIALQLGVDHWFYLYIVWFFPAVMVALLAGGPPRSLGPAGAPRARSLSPLPAPTGPPPRSRTAPASV